MPEGTIYEDGKKVPSETFLAHVIILLRKCEMETGMSLVQWLEDFEIGDENLDVDAYDDKTLRKAIHKYKTKMYPPKENN